MSLQERMTAVGFFHQFGFQGNPAEKRDSPFPGQGLPASSFKQLNFLAAVRAGQNAHVFNDTQEGEVDFFQKLQ